MFIFLFALNNFLKMSCHYNYYPFILAITVRPVQRSYMVRENAGGVGVCFRISDGSIATNTFIQLRGKVNTVDGLARGKFQLTFFKKLYLVVSLKYFS